MSQRAVPSVRSKRGDHLFWHERLSVFIMWMDAQTALSYMSAAGPGYMLLWPRRHVTAMARTRSRTVTVHVVIRKNQNEHGFIHTNVVGLFRSWNDADAFVESSISAADEGLRVRGDLRTEPDWEVPWMIESHPLSQRLLDERHRRHHRSRRVPAVLGHASTNE